MTTKTQIIEALRASKAPMTAADIAVVTGIPVKRVQYAVSTGDGFIRIDPPKGRTGLWWIKPALLLHDAPKRTPYAAFLTARRLRRGDQPLSYIANTLKSRYGAEVEESTIREWCADLDAPKRVYSPTPAPAQYSAAIRLRAVTLWAKWCGVSRIQRVLMREFALIKPVPLWLIEDWTRGIERPERLSVHEQARRLLVGRDGQAVPLSRVVATLIRRGYKRTTAYRAAREVRDDRA